MSDIINQWTKGRQVPAGRAETVKGRASSLALALAALVIAESGLHIGALQSADPTRPVNIDSLD